MRQNIKIPENLENSSCLILLPKGLSLANIRNQFQL